MEKHDWSEIKKPDKPYNPYNPLEDHFQAGKIKHCDLFDKCIDCCNDCLFNTLYHLNPQPGEDPNKWSYGDLADNEY